MFRKLDDLLDRSHRTDLIHIVDPQILCVNGFLCSQKYLLFFCHCLLNCSDGTLSAHVEVDHHLRHDGHSPERDHRQALYLVVHSISSSIKTKGGYTWKYAIVPA